MARRQKASTETRPAAMFRVAVVAPVLFGLSVAFIRGPASFLEQKYIFWIVTLAIIELFPVPAWKGLQLSLGFPIRLGLAMLYPPAVAAGLSLLGTFDPREIRGERRLLAALFDRCQISLAVLVGSYVFHSFASLEPPGSPWYILIPVVLLATAANYSVNVALVSTYMRIASGLPFSQALSTLRLGSPIEFVLSYAGLSLVGVAMARLYMQVNFWAVVVFILPLAFARQMFFRTMALEEAHKVLKDREKVLRALSNRMAEERHDERMQIAGYLHDDLAQMLFRLTLQVEMAKKRLTQSDLDGVSRDLDGINNTKQQASDMVRALIRDLHRSPIGRAGLAEALHSFAMDARSRFETPIVVDVQEPTLPPPIQLLIYQIAREAAMNALKHAEAETIWITLHETGEGVQLQIRDDGKGFDTEAASPEGHFGSVMMRERALVAGGTFSIRSEIGKGTEITAAFPRVWVEEGTLHEAEGTIRPAEVTRAPVGTSTGPADPLDSPRPEADSNGQVKRKGRLHVPWRSGHDRPEAEDPATPVEKPTVPA